MRKTVFAVALVSLIGIGSVAVATVGQGWGRGGDSAEAVATVGHGFGIGGDSADRVGIVQEILSDLVTDGTITQDQSDAITTALEEKKEEIAAQRQEAKEQLASFWEDEVLTTEEIEQLPFGDRILEAEGLSDALEDGQITKEEIAAQRREAKEQLVSFWEDEVLTTEEIEQLPFGDRILEAEGLSDALEDGQITKEEMEELGFDQRRHGKRRGLRH